MHIEDWPISKPIPYPNNPRVLRNAAQKVAESIKEFGFRQPIVVDGEGVIIIGHARLAAAKLLKLKTVPVHVVSDLPPEKVRALRLADNKTAEEADWDELKLADELNAIMESVGNIELTGFSASEFEAMAMQSQAELVEAGLTTPDEPDDEPDDAPEPDDEDSDVGDTGNDEPVREMMPFNVLMGADEREVLYEAIAKAKREHGLERTGDAMLVIARAYLNA